MKNIFYMGLIFPFRH